MWTALLFCTIRKPLILVSPLKGKLAQINRNLRKKKELYRFLYHFSINKLTEKMLLTSNANRLQSRNIRIFSTKTDLTVCSCHVTYALQSESRVYSTVGRGRREIWSLSDCNSTRTQNHLVCKRTLNHLAKLAKWLSVRLRTKWFWVRVELQKIDFIKLKLQL